MKRKPSARIVLLSEMFGKMVADLSGSLDAYRRENAVLREILLEQGLSLRAIQSKVRRRMKSYQIYEEAIVLSRKVCQEMIGLLQRLDPLEKILESAGEIEKKDAN